MISLLNREEEISSCVELKCNSELWYLFLIYVSLFKHQFCSCYMSYEEAVDKAASLLKKKKVMILCLYISGEYHRCD